MSRTDVHRPFDVQARDWHNRHRLLGFAQGHRAWDNPAGDPTTGRRWPWPMPLYGTCGCDVCAGGCWRRRARRKVRHAWTRQQRELLKAAREDVDLVDVATERVERKSYW